jgi:hypothetical protein
MRRCSDNEHIKFVSSDEIRDRRYNLPIYQMAFERQPAEGGELPRPLRYRSEAMRGRLPLEINLAEADGKGGNPSDRDHV